jgi:protein-S-isoprenylcysteine O-methyltransferase Ste14
MNRLRRAQVRDGLLYWVVIPAAVIGGGTALDRLLGLPRITRRAALTVLAAALLLAGNLLVAWSMRDLARLGRGTPNPLAPPRRLVVEGSYALCRHPMFLGYDLVALGVVLLLGSPGALLGTLPALLLLEVAFLRLEERGLARRFPGRFEEYRRRVPFLLPRPPSRRRAP